MPKRQPFFRHRPTSDQPIWKLRFYAVLFESETRTRISCGISSGLSPSFSLSNTSPDLFCVRDPWGYVFSFYGVIDLVAFLPNYINLFIPTGKYFFMIRVLRVLRVFPLPEAHASPAGESHARDCAPRQPAEAFILDLQVSTR
jgi:hypothetical protein